jgi:hypothetical protein
VLSRGPGDGVGDMLMPHAGADAEQSGGQMCTASEHGWPLTDIRSPEPR